MTIDYSERVEVECIVCDDSGWRFTSCAGMHDIVCGRPRRHLPHDFAVPCDCRAINRAYQARLASQGRVA